MKAPGFDALLVRLGDARLLLATAVHDLALFVFGQAALLERKELRCQRGIDNCREVGSQHGPDTLGRIRMRLLRRGHGLLELVEENQDDRVKNVVFLLEVVVGHLPRHP